MMDTSGPQRIRAVGEAWQRTVQAAKEAAAKPPEDLTDRPQPKEDR